MVEKPITFKCENEQIVGILHFPENQKFHLIIIVHGWSSNKLGPHSFFVKTAREFARNGFGALRFDFRGSEDSEGSYENQAITSMLKDLEAVISNVSEIKGIEKICLIRHSRGAYLSLLQASRDERISCVIVWCGSVQKEPFKGIILGEIERNGYTIFRNFLITKKYVEDSLKYDLDVKKIKVQVRLIYGELDDITYPSLGVKIYNSLECPKKLERLEDLDRFFSKQSAQEKVISITLKWLKEWL